MSVRGDHLTFSGGVISFFTPEFRIVTHEADLIFLT